MKVYIYRHRNEVYTDGMCPPSIGKACAGINSTSTIVMYTDREANSLLCFHEQLKEVLTQHWLTKIVTGMQ